MSIYQTNSVPSRIRSLALDRANINRLRVGSLEYDDPTLITTAPYTISTPGVYRLDDDLVLASDAASKDAILIDADDVCLLGNCHRITLDYNPITAGQTQAQIRRNCIRIPKSHKNIFISDVILSGIDRPDSNNLDTDWYGIRPESTSGLTCVNVTFEWLRSAINPTIGTVSVPQANSDWLVLECRQRDCFGRFARFTALTSGAAISPIYGNPPLQLGKPHYSGSISAQMVVAAPPDASAVPGNVAGKIALVLRGAPGADVQIKNCQDGGAVAVIIYNNAAGDIPRFFEVKDLTITIPSTGISNNAGLALIAAAPLQMTFATTSYQDVVLCEWEPNLVACTQMDGLEVIGCRVQYTVPTDSELFGTNFTMGFVCIGDGDTNTLGTGADAPYVKNVTVADNDMTNLSTIVRNNLRTTAPNPRSNIRWEHNRIGIWGAASHLPVINLNCPYETPITGLTFAHNLVTVLNPATSVGFSRAFLQIQNPDGVLIAHNNFTINGDYIGILDTGFAYAPPANTQMVVEDNVFSGNAFFGVAINSEINTTVRRNNFAALVRGVYCVDFFGFPSSILHVLDNEFKSCSYGVYLEDNLTGTIVSGNKFTGQTTEAITVAAASVVDTLITLNQFLANVSNLTDSGTNTVVPLPGDDGANINGP